MPEQFESNDRGKRVVTAEGYVIGRIDHVEDGEAYVRPKPGLLGGCGSWITDPKTRLRTVPLNRRAVAAITATEIRLEERRDEPRRRNSYEKIEQSR